MTDSNDVVEGLNAVEEVLDGLWAKASGLVDNVFTAALAWVDAKRIEVLDSTVGAVEVDLGEAGNEEKSVTLEDMLETVREKAASFLGERSNWDKWVPSGVDDENLLIRVYNLAMGGFWDVPVKDTE
jgi:hypothetical protein